MDTIVTVVIAGTVVLLGISKVLYDDEEYRRAALVLLSVAMLGQAAVAGMFAIDVGGVLAIPGLPQVDGLVLPLTSVLLGVAGIGLAVGAVRLIADAVRRRV